jgi:hypothetical protein
MSAAAAASRRHIRVIAGEILADWRAIPPVMRRYVEMLQQVDHVDEPVSGLIDGARARLLVRWFLADAGGWRGLIARRVKTELRALVDAASIAELAPR